MPPDLQRESTQYDAARRLLERCVTVAPDHACLHTRLGFCYAATGDVEAAETSLNRALALDPAEVTAHLVLGWMLNLLRRVAEAQQQYRAVLALDPDHDEARRRLVELSRGDGARAPGGAAPAWWAARAAELERTGLLD